MSRRAASSQGYRAHSSTGQVKDRALRQAYLSGGSMNGRQRSLSPPGSLIGPYGLEQDERRPQTSHRLVDKQSILWRDFLNGIKRRKRALNRLREVAEDPVTTSSTIKRLLLDIREMTLRLIEDALEIEYKASTILNTNGNNQNKSTTSGGLDMSKSTVTAPGGRTPFQTPLPPITSYKGMEDKEDILALSDIITDVDDLYKLPSIQVFLPMEFPSTRNPFLLGKSVDELSDMVAPKPTPGHLEEELKVLEIMRYKRASRCLLKAETQVLNRLPIFLPEIEKIWLNMNSDSHVERLIRCVLTLLANDKPDFQQEPVMHHFTDKSIKVEPYEFLNRLNAFVGQEPMRVDVQTSVRKALRDCNLEYMEDNASVYLIEWVNSVLSGTFVPTSDMSIGLVAGGPGSMAGGSMGSDFRSYRSADVGRPVQTIHNNLQSQQYANSAGMGMMSSGGGSVNVSPMKGVQYSPTSLGGAGGDMVSIVRSEDEKYRAGVGIMANAPPRRKAMVKGGVAPPRSIGSSQDDSTIESGTHLAAPSPSKAIVPPGGKHPRKSKKKKETDKEKRRREKEELGELIGSEVQRILKEQGIRKATDEDALSEEERLSSIRFELLKMQQELLRRKVLDPRHYKVASIDHHALQERGLTVQYDQLDQGEVPGPTGKRKKKIPARTMTIAEKNVTIRGGRGSVQVILDLVEDTLLVKLERLLYFDEDANEIDAVDQWKEDNPDKADTLEEKREPIAQVPVSRLMLNRLTNFTLDDVLDEQDDAARKKMLFEVCEQVRRFYHTLEPEEQYGVVEADRVLLKTAITYEGTAFDVLVTRNVDCRSVTLLLTPLTRGIGEVDSGPLSLEIKDQEMQVLLINQRGLYLLSQNKWSCMEMVAQWLTSRVKVKRISILGPGQEPRVDDGSKAARLAKRKQLLAGTSAENGDAEEKNNNSILSPIKGAEGDLHNALGPDFADLAPRGKKAALLDVSLDRQVEISDVAYAQWKTRNVPNIRDMSVRLDAYQDMEMIRFEMTMTFPHPTERKKKGNGFGDDVPVSNNKTRKDDIVIVKTLNLTSTELSIFGNTETLEERKVSMSMKNDGNTHPAAFMWNILSRLKPTFKGKVAQPFSKDAKADDEENWELLYDRRLLRDIRSISGGVMTINVTAINTELLYEAEPTDGSIFRNVGSKLLGEDEIGSLAYEEAWPLKLLDYSQRAHMAYRCLEKMKVVIDRDDKNRLELYTFPEQRMLFVYQQNVPGKPDIPLGTLEINDHMTLADLRVMIKHELDRDLVPRLYRFFYKGGPCAVRQEPFRRSWEVLPKCILIPRTQNLEKNDELAAEAEKRKLQMEEKLKTKKSKLRKDQRRAPGNLVPVPVYTLARIQEDSGDVYLLHDSRNLFVAGDVIRLGSTLARDYIVGIRSKALINTTPKTLIIDPIYDLIGEDDFELPIHGMAPTPAKQPYNPHTGEPLLEPYSKWNIKYDLPKPKAPPVDLSASLDGKIKVRDERNPNKVVGQEKVPKKLEGAGGEMNAEEEIGAAEVRAAPPAPKGGEPEPGTIWTDVWVWKCIPPNEDNRPHWRLKYDAGEVPYVYEHQDSPNFERNFRVKAPIRLMEVLCTDVRCPDMTIHHQRVHEMTSFSIDYYSKLAFKSMTEWYPQFKRGIESSKFLKMVRNMNLFADIKRPARVSQIDLLFTKEANSDNGIMDKYVNYVGFVRLIQDLALIRFPPPGQEEDDNASVANSSVTGSVSTTKTGKKSKDGSTVTGSPSMISRKSKNSAAPAGGGGKGAKGKGKSNLFGDNDSVGTPKSGKSRKSRNSEDGDENEQVVVDPEHAAWCYRKVVVDYLMAIPEWFELAWKEAKRMAMSKESKKYCAATRIAAIMRGKIRYDRYHNFRYQMVILQSGIRRKQGRKYYRGMVVMMEQDWLFRVRYHAATKMQALLRRYLSRVRHYYVMLKRKAEEVKVQKARRFRLKKIRAKEKKSILYREVKRVNGIMVAMYIARKDARNYSKDMGIIVRVYIPKSSQTFKFIIEEHKLRQYMEKELEVEAVGAGELLDKRCLQRVVSARLIIRKAARVGAPPQVIFSKQAMGQRGALVLTTGKIIDGHYFVCKVYETGDDLTITCYHRLTCKLFQAQIGVLALRHWITSDHKANCKDERLKHLDPPLLSLERKRGYYLWAVDHVRVDTRKGQFRVLFEIQLAKSRKGQLLIQLQAQWRRAIVRNKIRSVYDAFVVKVKQDSSAEATCYYVDRRTGDSFWEKPRLLGWAELTEQPSHRWVDFAYYDASTPSGVMVHNEETGEDEPEPGTWYTHYVNPWTGKYTHLTQDRAARIMQSLVRRKQLMPMLVTREEFKRVVPFVLQAKDMYEATPTRLLAVINYALVAHIVYMDEPLAKRLYIEAVNLAEANPLVTRAFGFFVLGTCEPPIKVNRERALRLISDAARRDPNHNKFEMAYVLYRYACLRQPRNVRVLCNRALVDALLYTQNWNAERMMRRALSIAPFEQRVMEIWKYIKERFPDRQVLHNAPARIGGVKTFETGKPPRIIHGRPAYEDPAWAGWVYIQNDEYGVSKIVGPYWYNPASGEERTKVPEWYEQWTVRRNRSEWNGLQNGLHHYYDPLTAEYFVYHEISDTYN